nr:IS3 family transposase [Clostridium botulinum]
MTIPEISSKYGIAKSTIAEWIKDKKEIKVTKDEIITLREVMELKRKMAKIRKENEILKKAIKGIYSENKGLYGSPRIHHILETEGFKVSLKRVQRHMAELGLCAITAGKYKFHSNKKVFYNYFY